MNLFIEYLNVNKRYGAFFLSLFFLVSKEHAFQLSVHKLTLLVHTNKVVCIYYCQSHNLVGSSAPSLHHCLAEVKQTCEPPKCQSLLRGHNLSMEKRYKVRYCLFSGIIGSRCMVLVFWHRSHNSALSRT